MNVSDVTEPNGGAPIDPFDPELLANGATSAKLTYRIRWSEFQVETDKPTSPGPATPSGPGEWREPVKEYATSRRAQCTLHITWQLNTSIAIVQYVYPIGEGGMTNYAVDKANAGIKAHEERHAEHFDLAFAYLHGGKMDETVVGPWSAWFPTEDEALDDAFEAAVNKADSMASSYQSYVHRRFGEFMWSFNAWEYVGGWSDGTPKNTSGVHAAEAN